ncbi:TPA: sigma-70 family RNA polymerase sigma factor [Clostridioides difficile]|nr:sigma-70 family RNA polymerase sigma factor [Clostridioides difficile]HDN2401287.1 sigma-70 family RNA polymerase sigma factor [Clostridioides difficile]HDN2402308.1 sigma-70 family RNA polymerase sigma factor [Clostridioides difficile]
MVDEKTIEHQFDSFCKTVLRNYARYIYDENKRRNDYLVSLESLSLAELSKLSILDDYDSNYICMVSYDYNIRIEDVLMAQAIGKLTKRKQIILLSFFLNMTNADIATLMDLSENTIHYHKTNALKELKELMEEH